MDYKFENVGKYPFKLVFADKMTFLRQFFEDNTNLISLDLSNSNTTKVNDMSFMFHNCFKLKEIKGINKFITNKVTTMESTFSECNALEY